MSSLGEGIDPSTTREINMGVDVARSDPPDVLTMITHELKQPLAAIAAYAQASNRWLDRETPDVTKAHLLAARIAANARRASDIVDSMRRLATGGERVSVPMDLNVLTRDACQFVLNDLAERGIELALDLAEDLPAAEGDPSQFQQVITNLVVNAMQSIDHALADTRVITVSTYLEVRGQVGFSVLDSGPGIPDGALRHLFSPWFTTKPDGTGIGLAICRSIILSHRGDIRVANHVDGGARFAVTLPAASAAPP